MENTKSFRLHSVLVAFSLVALFASLPHEAMSAGAASDWSRIPSRDFTIPDAPTDEESQAEIPELLRLQSLRTQEDCELSENQRHPSFDVLFESSQVVTPDEVTAVSPLFSRAVEFGERVANYFKSKYRRVRPYNFDASVQPCVTQPSGAKSYPSSHATMASVGACLLAEVYPDRAAKIRAEGAKLGKLRSRVGVHFPSDVKAGQGLAHDICERLLQDPSFQAELEALRN